LNGIEHSHSTSQYLFSILCLAFVLPKLLQANFLIQSHCCAWTPYRMCPANVKTAQALIIDGDLISIMTGISWIMKRSLGEMILVCYSTHTLLCVEEMFWSMS
jgi:hypothetical protein